MRRPFVLAWVMVAALGGCSSTTGGTSPTSTTESSRPSTTTLAPISTSTTSAPTNPSTAEETEGFQWQSSVLPAAMTELMRQNSWHAKCPVPLSDLRLLEVTYWGFDGSAHWGQLVVNSDSVDPVAKAFRGLFKARFPIRQMRLVDYFGGSDERSMAADNTSAFNCRGVPGSSSWSQHAYGRAVDVDPLENPEIRNGSIDPPSARPWADRTRRLPGMIGHGDPVWQAFQSAGWSWGGDWTSLKDYQHFSANGL